MLHSSVKFEHQINNSRTDEKTAYSDPLNFFSLVLIQEGVSKSFRNGRRERELQMVQISATRCSCIAIL
jgi:hypothetical protein